MQSRALHISNLRGIARLINHAAFKKIALDSNQSSYIRQMKKYIEWDSIEQEQPTTLSELIAYGYSILEQDYRHEYIYKTSLLNDFVLHHYSLDDTVLLNEFRIQDSIADMVIVNGTNKVFEIKTELDSLERFKSQIENYYKAFTEVYLVTHYSLIEKYSSKIEETVGIIALTDDLKLVEHRKAAYVDELLDIPAMMATLRKPEYMKLVKNMVGFVPDATPVYLYTACLDVLLSFTPQEVQKQYHKILKERISFVKNIDIEEGAFPKFYNYSYYHQKLTKNSYLTLQNNLMKKV